MGDSRRQGVGYATDYRCSPRRGAAEHVLTAGCHVAQRVQLGMHFGLVEHSSLAISSIAAQVPRRLRTMQVIFHHLCVEFSLFSNFAASKVGIGPPLLFTLTRHATVGVTDGIGHARQCLLATVVDGDDCVLILA